MIKECLWHLSKCRYPFQAYTSSPKAQPVAYTRWHIPHLTYLHIFLNHLYISLSNSFQHLTRTLNSVRHVCNAVSMIIPNLPTPNWHYPCSSFFTNVEIVNMKCSPSILESSQILTKNLKPILTHSLRKTI